MKTLLHATYRTHFKYKNTGRLKVKGCGRIYDPSTYPTKSRMVILMSSETYSNKKSIILRLPAVNRSI